MKDWKFHCLILGIPESATLKEVRRAYRKLALELHPDKHNNSLAAKDDFQQLNESYRHLSDTLKRGPRPAPAHTPPSTARRAFAAPRTREAPKNFAKIWIHAGIACAVLLVLSFWAEHAGEKSHRREVDARDLSVKAWCFVSHFANGRETRDVTEYWAQNVCEARCQASLDSAHTTCAWNGHEFQSAKRESIALRPPDLHHDPETGLAVAKEINLPQIQQEENFPVPAPTLPEEPSVFRATCYMTMVLPGNPVANAIPNETAASCADRCTQEIVAHPLDGIIKCAFAGRELINHVPDPMATYLARNPAQSGFQQGNTFVANCEIYAMRNGLRMQARAGLSSRMECESLCKREATRSGRSSELNCLYNGQKISSDQPAD